MAYCVEMKMPGGQVSLVRLSGKRTPKCGWCDKNSTKLCDHVVSPPEQVTHKRTCDAAMCSDHAKNVGPNRDYCPIHA